VADPIKCIYILNKTEKLSRYPCVRLSIGFFANLSLGFEARQK